MSKYRTTEILGKEINLWPSYSRPDKVCFVGREKQLQLTLAAMATRQGQKPLPVVFIGVPGSGKTTAVSIIGEKLRKDVFVFQCHAKLDADDISCSMRESDQDGRIVDYVASPLTTAMVLGGIAYLDEADELAPDAWAPLASVLDDRCYLDSTLLGGRIYPAPGFRLIVAANTLDSIPEKIRSRLMPRVHFGYPSREQIELVILSSFGERLGEDPTRFPPVFSKSWDRHAPPGRRVVERDVHAVFEFALRLANEETPTEEHLHEAVKARVQAGAPGS